MISGNQLSKSRMTSALGNPLLLQALFRNTDVHGLIRSLSLKKNMGNGVTSISIKTVFEIER